MTAHLAARVYDQSMSRRISVLGVTIALVSLAGIVAFVARVLSSFENLWVVILLGSPLVLAGGALLIQRAWVEWSLRQWRRRAGSPAEPTVGRKCGYTVDRLPVTHTRRLGFWSWRVVCPECGSADW